MFVLFFYFLLLVPLTSKETTSLASTTTTTTNTTSGHTKLTEQSHSSTTKNYLQLATSMVLYQPQCSNIYLLETREIGTGNYNYYYYTRFFFRHLRESYYDIIIEDITK